MYMNLYEHMMNESRNLNKSKKTKKKLSESKKLKRRVKESFEAGSRYRNNFPKKDERGIPLPDNPEGSFEIVKIEDDIAYLSPLDDSGKKWLNDLYKDAKSMYEYEEDEFAYDLIKYYDSEGLMGVDIPTMEDDSEYLVKLESKKRVSESRSLSKSSRKRINEATYDYTVTIKPKNTRDPEERFTGNSVEDLKRIVKNNVISKDEIVSVQGCSIDDLFEESKKLKRRVKEDFEYDETSEEDRGIYDWISTRVAGDIFYKFWDEFNNSEEQDFMEAVSLLVKVYKSMYNRQKK